MSLLENKEEELLYAEIEKQRLLNQKKLIELLPKPIQPKPITPLKSKNKLPVIKVRVVLFAIGWVIITALISYFTVLRG